MVNPPAGVYNRILQRPFALAVLKALQSILQYKELAAIWFEEMADVVYSNQIELVALKARDSTVLSIRPNVAEHCMVLFSRSVHPELFRIYRTHNVQRSNYKARLDITSDGHIITFSCGSMTLCEVIASQNQMLPQRRQITSHRVTERKHYETENKNLVHYETDFSVETAPRDLFWKIQEHFGRCNSEHELLQVFNASGRVALGAISYMHIEQRSKRLTVQAFHTFPDEYSILKSVSTFTVTR